MLAAHGHDRAAMQEQIALFSPGKKQFPDGSAPDDCRAVHMQEHSVRREREPFLEWTAHDEPRAIRQVRDGVVAVGVHVLYVTPGHEAGNRIRLDEDGVVLAGAARPGCCPVETRAGFSSSIRRTFMRGFRSGCVRSPRRGGCGDPPWNHRAVAGGGGCFPGPCPCGCPARASGPYWPPRCAAAHPHFGP